MEKLQNTKRSSEAYWPLLKIFLNNKKYIPSLYHKNKFEIQFKKKAELFNAFFTDRFSLISNNSKLPNQLEYLTQSRLTLITFSTVDIAKMIQNLDRNKTFTWFLSKQKTKSSMNGQVSSWANVKAGVRQGLILGPLLFFYLYQ